MNENGHPQTLQPFTPGNTAALRHCLYSGRALSERAAEIRDARQEAPWTQPLDVIAAEEIGSVVAALETIDLELQARQKAAARRMLLEHKGRLTRELRAWLTAHGFMMPRWVQEVTPFEGR